MNSWGQFPKVFNQQSISLPWRNHAINYLNDTYYLPYGKGRSYGDSCLNENGTVIETKWLNHLIHFDTTTGILRCEAGITLDEILQIIIKHGWFLPVLPGTKYVTLGGAIANDIHGKNHHRAGTFGCHVIQFELLRSDGKSYVCSEQQNKALFDATLGGLGLTGLIIWAEIQLKPITNEFLDVQTIQFESLSEFFDINEASINDYEYTVAWVDCLATEKKLGRGIYMRANHNKSNPVKPIKKKNRNLQIPINFPSFILNAFSIKLFNHFYYNKTKSKFSENTQHYDSFFFPLDTINNWNKIYGRRGFLQYQCVVEDDEHHTAITKILNIITQSKQGSFLSVLKTFGEISSPGLLSFPKPGVTLALDFQNKGSRTFSLLNQLDEIVQEFNGRVYPAKDARMSAYAFQQYYPKWKQFKELLDPKFSSNLWRRVSHEK